MEEVNYGERLRRAARKAEAAKGELHQAAGQRGDDYWFRGEFGRVERAWYRSENPAESPEFSASVAKAADKLDAFDRGGLRPSRGMENPRRQLASRAARKEPPAGHPWIQPWWNEFVADPSKMDLRAWLARLPLHLAKADPNPGFGYEDAFRRALR
jgi:hypothetical protein